MYLLPDEVRRTSLFEEHAESSLLCLVSVAILLIRRFRRESST